MSFSSSCDRRKRQISQNKQRACLSFEKAGSPHLICYASGSLLFVISNRMTSIFTSVLHFGQYRGNRKRTVSSYTFVRVFPPQIGQRIQRELFGLSILHLFFNKYTITNLEISSLILVSKFFELCIFDARFYIASINRTKNDLIILPTAITILIVPSVFKINIPTRYVLSFFII